MSILFCNFVKNKTIDMDYEIRKATEWEAGEIGRAVITAITPELVLETFGRRTNHGFNIESYQDFFSLLAMRDDTQYSYLNALIADGRNPIDVYGVLVGYDGARLLELRKVFIDKMNHWGIKIEEDFPLETDPSEFYLDTLAVKRRYRGQGVGRALLLAGIEEARKIGKPAGLLVDKKNDRARRLYESVGFRKVGERMFIDELMDHLQAE